MAKKKILFSIAVSNAEDLQSLPGTIRASEELAKWGKACDFETHLISDAETDPASGQPVAVTVDRLSKSISPILQTNAGNIKHLIIHFAGHGFIPGIGSQILLLSNWRSQANESIDVAQLTVMLDFFKIDARTLIIDACSGWQDASTDAVFGAAIVDKGEELTQRFQNSQRTQINAAVEGRLAYMLKKDGDTAPICLFTGALMKALAGQTNGNADEVSYSNLRKFAAEDFEAIANGFGVDQTALVTGGLSSPNDIYTTLPINYQPPQLPSAAAVAAQAAVLQAEVDQAASMRAEVDDEFEDTVHSADPEGTSPASADATENFGETSMLPRNGGVAGKFKKGVSDTAEWASDWLIPDMLRPFTAHKHMDIDRDPISRGPVTKPNLKVTTKGNRLAKIFDSRTERPITRSAGPDSDIIIDNIGSKSRGISIADWSGVGLFPRNIAPPQPDLQPPFHSSIALILPNGNVVPAYTIPTYKLTFTLDHRNEGDADLSPDGPLALDYSPISDDGDPVGSGMNDIFIRMNDNALKLADLKDASIQFRHGKHVNPMRGIIAAYLSSAAGDIDAVRRIAWFYHRSGQPIPFDIALLADAEGRMDDNKLVIDLPETAINSPASQEEENHLGYQRQTGAIEGARVVGRYPVMAQGWARLEYSMLPVDPALVEIAGDLNRYYIVATLNPSGGAKLVNLITNKEI